MQKTNMPSMPSLRLCALCLGMTSGNGNFNNYIALKIKQIEIFCKGLWKEMNAEAWKGLYSDSRSLLGSCIYMNHTIFPKPEGRSWSYRLQDWGFLCSGFLKLKEKRHNACGSSRCSVGRHTRSGWNSAMPSISRDEAKVLLLATFHSQDVHICPLAQGCLVGCLQGGDMLQYGPACARKFRTLEVQERDNSERSNTRSSMLQLIHVL